MVIEFDKLWEGVFCGYVMIIKDYDLYCMYYWGFFVVGLDGFDVEVICYVESLNGIDWMKLELGFFEWEGDWDNNIVLSG